MTGPSQPRITRLEWQFLVLVLLGGTLLRFWYPGHMAVEHFDEGVYASNDLIETPEFVIEQYLLQEFYAPPMVPILSRICRGPASWSPLLPGLLAGLLTIPAVWFLTRSWFGPLAGMVASVVAALSDFHILYSRTILTDAPLGLFIILGVFGISFCYHSMDPAPPTPGKKKRARNDQSAARGNAKFTLCLLAGFLTSLAWWTKYNGWLPLAIGISGLLPWLIFNQPKGQSRTRYLATWGEICVIAYLFWVPVVIGLQGVGGYNAVAENHKGYLVGIENWTSSLVRQYQNHLLMDGVTSRISLLAALLIPLFFTWSHATLNDPGGKKKSSRHMKEYSITAGLGLVLAISSFYLGSSLILVLISIAGGIGCLVMTLFQRESGTESPTQISRRNIWLLTAWFTGLALATPFYRAYPRLTLPWLVSSWIAAGGILSWCLGRIHQFVSKSNGAPEEKYEKKSNAKQATGVLLPATLGVLLIGLTVVFFLSQMKDRTASSIVKGWEDRTGLEKIATGMIEKLDEAEPENEAGSSPKIVATYGQPALYFHLGFQVNERYKETGKLDFVPVVVGGLQNFLTGSQETEEERFLIVSQKQLENELSSEWELVQNRFEKMETFAYKPSLLVRLNEYSPEELSRMNELVEIPIHLFRVKQ